MKYFVMSVIAIIVSITIKSASQNEYETLTNGLFNGRAWREMSDDNKLMLLSGYEEGAFMYYQEARNSGVSKQYRMQLDECTKRITVRGFKMSDVSDVVDGFYKDRANIRIPAVYAYYYAIKRLKGEDPYVLEIWTAGVRRAYAK